MRDIVLIEDGRDMRVEDSIVPKAANLLSSQLGRLIYAEDFGVDIAFFLDNPIVFENESFKSYLIQQLAQRNINTIDAINIVENLYAELTLSLQDNQDNNEGFIR